jgi:hypothetical protein
LGLRRQQEVRWVGGLACPGHGLAESPHQPCRLQRCTLATPESRLTRFAQARDWRAVPRHGPTAAVNPNCQSNPSSLPLNNIAKTTATACSNGRRVLRGWRVAGRHCLCIVTGAPRGGPMCASHPAPTGNAGVAFTVMRTLHHIPSMQWLLGGGVPHHSPAS